MVFKFSFHLTLKSKKALETAVFPPEEKTTEKYECCHLNE